MNFRSWSEIRGRRQRSSCSPYIIFFGIIQGEGLRAKHIAGEEINPDVFDCYDWIDEQGGLDSDEVERVQNLYVGHNETN